MNVSSYMYALRVFSKRSCHVIRPWAQRCSQQHSTTFSFRGVRFNVNQKACWSKLAWSEDRSWQWRTWRFECVFLAGCPLAALAWHNTTYLFHWHGLGPRWRFTTLFAYSICCLFLTLKTEPTLESTFVEFYRGKFNKCTGSKHKHKMKSFCVRRYCYRSSWDANVSWSMDWQPEGGSMNG